MHSVVIYATTSGNTRLVAQAMADALGQLGTTDVMPVEGVGRELPEADLLLIGAPTERHTMSQPMSELLGRLSMRSARGRPIGTFDTRLRWPRLLSGSAADDIARRLRAAGARIVGAPGSFAVTMEPRLVAGETERAAAWAVQVARLVEARAAA